MLQYHETNSLQYLDKKLLGRRYEAHDFPYFPASQCIQPHWGLLHESNSVFAVSIDCESDPRCSECSCSNQQGTNYGLIVSYHLQAALGVEVQRGVWSQDTHSNRARTIDDHSTMNRSMVDVHRYLPAFKHSRRLFVVLWLWLYKSHEMLG